MAVTDSIQTGVPGGIVTFTGTVTPFNAFGPSSAPASDYLFTFSGYSASLTPTQLLDMSGLTINDGETSPTVDFFSVTLASTMAPGTYPVDYELDQNFPDDEGRDATGEVDIVVTPEPSTIWLMATGLILLSIALPGLALKKAKQAAD